MITTDGMPLVWFCRLEGHAGTERVYGPDLLLAVCEAGLSSGRRHCFYGGAPGVAEALADRLKARFPGLQVAAAISPPFSNGHTDADAARGAAAVIDACAPDFVWVGLGAPKQEIWMADHRPYLKAPVLVGVGAAFDFLSGARPQAPAVMRRFGLEWLFRLASEPRRLWPRYSRVAPAFLYHVARQRLRRSVRQGG
jgi:N-acetylglucosaminyldiphosphoundecaprenol N-acetyl-beta-D-mannosaminyltransferase